MEKVKPPYWPKFCYEGVALGLKWRYANFGDFYKSKIVQFTMLMAIPSHLLWMALYSFSIFTINGWKHKPTKKFLWLSMKIFGQSERYAYHWKGEMPYFDTHNFTVQLMFELWDMIKNPVFWASLYHALKWKNLLTSLSPQTIKK